MNQYKCHACGAVKDTKDFYPNKTMRGHDAVCKACRIRKNTANRKRAANMLHKLKIAKRREARELKAILARSKNKSGVRAKDPTPTEIATITQEIREEHYEDMFEKLSTCVL